MKKNIPHLSLGKGAQKLIFVHANAYTPEAYFPLLSQVQNDYSIFAPELRPIWDKVGFTDFKNWSTIGDDLSSFMEQHQLENITAIGHSLGAVSLLMAAQQYANLFKKLILIEPVTFSKSMIMLSETIPFWIKKNLIPIIKNALNRRDSYPNLNVVFQSYRKKNIFKHITDTNLQFIIQGIFEKTENDEYTLKYPKQWEAKVYSTVPYYLDILEKIETPVHFLRGKKTDVISNSMFEKMKKLKPKNQHFLIPQTSHLLPFEAPEIVGKIINQLL